MYVQAAEHAHLYKVINVSHITVFYGYIAHK